MGAPSTIGRCIRLRVAPKTTIWCCAASRMIASRTEADSKVIRRTGTSTVLESLRNADSSRFCDSAEMRGLKMWRTQSSAPVSLQTVAASRSAS